MNYLNRMYNSKNVSSKTHENVSTKNPNRIAGGLKGQGVDHIVNLEKEKSGSKPSRIFKIDDGKILTIRK